MYAEYFQFKIMDAFALIMYVIGVLFMLGSMVKYPRIIFQVFSLIVLIHIVMTVGYWQYSKTNSSDALRYFVYGIERPEVPLSEYGISSGFIRLLIYPFATILNFSYGGGTLIFSFIGLLAYYILVKFIAQEYYLKYKMPPYSFLLFIPLLSPTLHFFTCAIGKDSVIFLGIVLFIVSALKRKYFSLAIAIVIIAMIRPHVLLAIGGGYAMALLFFNKKVPLFAKIMVVMVGVVAAYMVVPILMGRLGIDNLGDIEQVMETAEKYTTYNQSSNSSIDMSEANLFVKIISYLFRPLFIDAHNAMALVSSVDNLLWVAMIGFLFFNMSQFFKNKALKTELITLVMPFLLLLLILSFTLNNLGIAVRQKTMLFPFLLLLVMYISIIRKRRKPLIIKSPTKLPASE